MTGLTMALRMLAPSAPAPRMVLVPHEGWWCPCVGPGAEHPAAGCARRVRIRMMLPSYPDWRVPAPVRRAETVEHAEVRQPTVRCRTMGPDELLPSAAGTYGLKLGAAGIPYRWTYARGWGRRLSAVPDAEGVRHYESAEVESVALRSRCCAAAWIRYTDDPDARWRFAAGYVVTGGRILPVKATGFRLYVDALLAGGAGGGDGDGVRAGARSA